MTGSAFDELMTLRRKPSKPGEPAPEAEVTITGVDPVLPTRFKLGETSAAVQAAIGVAASDLWSLRTGRCQQVAVDVTHAAAALRSYQYLSVEDESLRSAFTGQRSRQGISTPHPTRDGRYFLPHMGLPHLGERILAILGCDYTVEAVSAAVAGWDALDLENAVAEAGACGAMVRSTAEWAEHPHGRALAARPVIELIKIADSDPEPLPKGLEPRPLAGVRALDLTRILAGPTCARTLAEHGADVLMVTAEDLPQTDWFVRDTSHGKRSCFLDLKTPAEATRLKELVREADVFSQGYRPGTLSGLGFSPESLAALRPGIIYTSMNCYGYDGPFRERAGWEQLAQTVTGIADEHGAGIPRLLPAAACDYLTGYLAAYGTLLALARRATEGGSWHVRASLCQSGMFLQRHGRVDADPGIDIPAAAIEAITLESQTHWGAMRHLGPVLTLSETAPRWDRPSPPLGSDDPAWLPR